MAGMFPRRTSLPPLTPAGGDGLFLMMKSCEQNSGTRLLKAEMREPETLAHRRQADVGAAKVCVARTINA